MTLVSSGALPLRPAERGKRVTAVLGPTNTGKTWLTIERMLTWKSGVIGLPLRLLAREVYNRVVEKVGADQVALITGEEKIKPRQPRYWICTVEAMPRDLDVDFVAIDEAQLAADLDRGHTFTDRILNRRGREETLIVGASTLEPALERLLPGVPVVTRPRLSQLTFAGHKKISRLPPRSAIVAFSAEEVYAIAELIRRQSGGAAVVLGALSPRTRNAQVALYQNGDVDYIIATDAIGMGLNLDVDHVAFAGDRKYDGWHHRRLHPAEFGQIAGRAGRHVKDGSFGTTGRCPPFDEDLVEALEQHRFDPVELLQWRNAALDFSSIEALQASLDRQPDEEGLTRAPLADDVLVLDIMAHDADVRKQTKTRADIQRLWEVCQVPDYRKLSPSAHAELVLTLFTFVVRAGHVPDDWFARQIAMFDRVDGDIDALSARTAQVRTFNYIANRPDWLADPEHWQGVTRQVEDNLSDALHERLAHRFIDRRTSVLMRRLRENAMLEAEINSAGDVLVEGQHVGRLNGFRFTPDPQAAGEAARALNAAAQKALASEIEARAMRVHEAVDSAFVLANDGLIRWLGEPVGRLAGGDHILRPRVRVQADDQLTGAALEMVQARLELWVAQHIKKLLGAVADLEASEGIEGIGRGIAFQLAESLGVLERSRVANDVKTLDQTGRAALRKLGVRFGAYHLYLPQLLKPAPRTLSALLWTLKHGGVEVVKGLSDVAHLASSGRTSFAADKETPKGLYQAAGFRVCGERAVRVDILERLADLVRPAINYRPGLSVGDPPPGTADGDGFVVTIGMTSLAGCSGEAFASILKSLGYAMESRKGPAITVPLVKAAPTEPVKQPDEEATPEASAGSADESAATEAESANESESEESTPARDETVVETGTSGSAGSDEPPVDAVSPVVEAPVEVASEEPTEPQETPAGGGEPVGAAASDEEAEPDAASATGSEPAAGAAATPEPDVPMIEVWRPGRRPQHREGPRPDRNRGRGPRRDGAGGHRPQRTGEQGVAAPAAGESSEQPVAASTAPVEGAPAPDRERHRRHEGFRPRGDRPPQGDRPQGQRPPQRERPPGQARADAGGSRPPHGGQRPHGGPRPQGEGRPQGQGRPFDKNRPGRGDRPFATTEKPAPRERAPDPNSPFAKLLALKASLEEKARKE